MKKLIAKLSQLFRTSAPTFQPAVVPVCRNATNHDRTGNQSYNQRNAPPHSNYRAGRKKSAQVPSTNHPRIGLVGLLREHGGVLSRNDPHRNGYGRATGIPSQSAPSSDRKQNGFGGLTSLNYIRTTLNLNKI